MTLPDITFLDNDLRHWGLALAVTVAATLLLRLVKAIVVSRLGALARRTTTTVDDALVDALKGTRVITMVAGGVAAGVTRLDLKPGTESVVMKVVLLVLILQVAHWIMATTLGNSAVARCRRAGAAGRPATDAADCAGTPPG